MLENKFRLVAGPCSAESFRQLDIIAKEVKRAKHFYAFRAGVWKPRTSPGSFEGYGETALKWLSEIKKKHNIPTMVEVASAEHVSLCMQYGVDILWIGARTTGSPFAVQEIAEAMAAFPNIPIWVKNPISPDFALWIGAIERLQVAGVKNIGAIHRGFRQYNFKPYRNAPMWELMLDLRRQKPEVPVICDPSHIAGDSQYIECLCQTAINMETNGLMLEVHPEPEKALSDSKQQITPEKFFEIYSSLIFRNDDTCIDKIEQYRTILSGVDNELLSLLAHRMKLIAEMGEIKKSENMSVLQLNHWNKMLEHYDKQCDKLGLNKEFMNRVLSLIHTESVRIQNEIFAESGKDSN